MGGDACDENQAALLSLQSAGTQLAYRVAQATIGSACVVFSLHDYPALRTRAIFAKKRQRLGALLCEQACQQSAIECEPINDAIAELRAEERRISHVGPRPTRQKTTEQDHRNVKAAAPARPQQGRD